MKENKSNDNHDNGIEKMEITTEIFGLAESSDLSCTHISKSETMEKNTPFKWNVPKQFVFMLKLKDENLYGIFQIKSKQPISAQGNQCICNH